jgi:hypothetical protein
MQLKRTEKNYPVHEKELLVVIHTLKKWRSDLLGILINVYTNHRMLQNFDTQWDLSQRQLCWQKYMSQYDMTIVYIPGEDNMVADTLSHVHSSAFPDEFSDDLNSTKHLGIHAMLSITTDPSVLQKILEGYEQDEFCKKFILASLFTPRVSTSNGLWYISDHLLIPRASSIHEDLFHLAHDAYGHFCTNKSYTMLRDTYYWPSMCRYLEKSYIPLCTECLCNKLATRKPTGPLHPLPIPDECGDSVAMDFIGPLPRDDDFNCILSITNQLRSDI